MESVGGWVAEWLGRRVGGGTMEYKCCHYVPHIVCNLKTDCQICLAS